MMAPYYAFSFEQGQSLWSPFGLVTTYKGPEVAEVAWKDPEEGQRSGVSCQ